ncbi:MAG: NAD(P)H-binding protein [Pseudomonadota bacterium]
MTSPQRIFLLGATGTIGRTTARALAARGHDVVCFIRNGADAAALPDAVEVRHGDATDPAALASHGFCGETFDAVVSCLASRTGGPKDAWAIDYRAHADALQLAKKAGVKRFVLLSAICVQKPKLEFQKAKLAFERELIASGLDYSIVRPTAFFKSLSGQIDRVKAGKPFLIFGDGTLTKTKPISDDDLATFLADCLDDPERRNKILPIGGPGPAFTPKEQGEALFAALGREVKFQRVPPAMFDVAAGVLGALGVLIPPLKDKAEYARIAKYYATESMLVWDEAAEEYDEAATPSAGENTLFDHHTLILRDDDDANRRDHAIF